MRLNGPWVVPKINLAPSDSLSWMEGGDYELSGEERKIWLWWYLAHGDLSRVSFKLQQDDEIGLNINSKTI